MNRTARPHPAARAPRLHAARAGDGARDHRRDPRDGRPARLQQPRPRELRAGQDPDRADRRRARALQARRRPLSRSTQEGLGALLAAPSGVANWNGPYLKDPKLLKDPWSRDFTYRSPGGEGRLRPRLPRRRRQGRRRGREQGHPQLMDTRRASAGFTLLELLHGAGDRGRGLRAGRALHGRRASRGRSSRARRAPWPRALRDARGTAIATQESAALSSTSSSRSFEVSGGRRAALASRAPRAQALHGAVGDRRREARRHPLLSGRQLHGRARHRRVRREASSSWTSTGSPGA